ncbi:MAG TPA: NTP transferase domain-containing protein [Acidobacteriota bacterium]|nr:NTP transferase domain-containing protein [Acidobacteriota bacterium]
MIPKFQALVLAAGMGKRMNSDLPKVLHPALGRPLIHHVLDRLDALKPARVIVVVGHKEELVRASCGPRGVHFVTQVPQLGTGHAVQVAWYEITEGPGRVLVLAGDMPLVRVETLKRLLERHDREENSVTVLTGILADPGGYGRVIRDQNGAFVKIVEEKDATAKERAVAEVNSGIYCFDRSPLKEALDSLRADNKQKEYYLTDTLAFMRGKGLRVGIEHATHESELMGVNTVAQLAEVEALLR